MKARGTIRILLAVLVAASSFWGVNKICHFLLQASQVSFSFDPLLSTNQKEKIIFTVTHAGLTNPTIIAQLMKEKCPAINKIIVTRQPNHSWHIQVIAGAPRLIVNTEWVLNEQGMLVPRGHYTPQSITQLPHITMKTATADAPLLSAEFKEWLNALNPALFGRYDISWNHDFEIELVEKNNPAFALVSTCQHRLTEQTITLCDSIKKDIEQQKNNQSAMGLYKADIRFDNQVVVSGGPRGGNKHG